ncbi:hypothetical protein [Stenotrophomonas maltophilia]|uniref:hypothetical protein n=1 Tax=Stenotrophomonas maltophilia TaxID=40324 RepID=UPI0015DE2774|nr:hypothetical protein [Stenotrophomonas maltophilia]MBA0446736.1 hypothetical protein [Stenotrophomonas maltophilia]
MSEAHKAPARLLTPPGIGSLAFMLRAFGVLLAIAASCNALLFSDAVATPLVQSDAWYFLESFLPRYFDGSLTFLDLFMQRGVGDHAQPLQKLVLLFHTKYFDMDFRVEGLIGILIGIAWCCAVAREMPRHALASPMRNAYAWLCIGLVFALGLSLNSSNIFTWPLATLGYIPLLLGALYFSLVMTQLQQARPWLVFAATLLLGLCTDEIALVLVIATALACVPLLTASRRDKAIALVAAVVALILVRGFLWWVAMRAGTGATMLPSRGLAESLLTADALKGLLIPFSDGLIHLELLSARFPKATQTAVMVCAGAVLALQVFFWVTVAGAWRRRTYNRTLAMATFLMLVAYALTAGIILSRVPAFDWNYLHQPRYVMSYQINLVAIAVMFHYRLTRPDASAPASAHASPKAWRVEQGAILLLVVGLLAVQWQASRYNWKLPHYLIPYWQNTALAMQRLATDPRTPPTACPDIMTVCGYPEEERGKLISLLVDKQLNVFSNRFQIRNRLYPSLATVPGFGPGAVQEQRFDRRIAGAPVKASLLAEPLSGSCAGGTSAAQPVRIHLDTRDLAPFGAQLWVDSVGAQRTLLASTAAAEPALTVEHALPDHSVLSLVRSDSQGVLAQQQLDLPPCAIGSPAR